MLEINQQKRDSGCSITKLELKHYVEHFQFDYNELQWSSKKYDNKQVHYCRSYKKNIPFDRIQ